MERVKEGWRGKAKKKKSAIELIALVTVLYLTGEPLKNHVECVSALSH